jgi:hypothetical protein
VQVIKSRRMRGAGARSAYEGAEYGVQGLLEKPEGKNPLGRPRRRWEEVGCGVWTGLSWLRIETGGGLL